MKKNSLKKVLAVLLVMTMMIPLLNIPIFAQEIKGTHLDGSTYQVTKVSNPDKGSGEIDGLMPGGDRASSYCWAMAENDGNVYIGTWANGLYQEIEVIGMYGNIFGAATGTSMDMATVDKIASLITHGEVSSCEPNSTSHAKLFRYNESTGAMDCIFNPEDYPAGHPHSAIYGFRGATTFKGNVYMDAMLDNAALNCEVWRIDPENNSNEPIVCMDGGSFRAICTNDSDTMMYTGGSCAVPEGYKSGCVIYGTDTGDQGDYDIIADSTDFEYYTRNGTSITVNDVCCYTNEESGVGEEVIASLVTSFGVTVWRGHPAAEGETANQYGWVWTELVGVNGQYPISMGNALNCTLTPAVFKGDLYLMSMINPMTGLITAGAGIVAQNQDLLFSGIDSMAETIRVRPSIYRLTKDGRMQMVVGYEKYCPDNVEYVAKTGPGFTYDETSFVMYNWREIEYNDRMYVNTIDVYNMYKYFTQLTNGQLLGMDLEEFTFELETLADLLSSISTGAGNDSEYAALLKDNAFVKAWSKYAQKAFINTLYSLYRGIDQKQTTAFLSYAIRNSVLYSSMISKMCDALTDGLEAGIFNSKNCQKTRDLIAMLQSLKESLASIVDNREHIENYMLISDACANYKTPGGDLWCSEDGVEWECITDNGFDDEYNHGVRTMVLGDDGSLYLGMANPYYGAQLWKLTDDAAEDVQSAQVVSPWSWLVPGHRLTPQLIRLRSLLSMMWTRWNGA